MEILNSMEKLDSLSNNILHSFSDDARPIYKTMLDSNCSLQFVWVEIMPWKEYESEEAIIWYLDEDSYENERGILFVKGDGIDDIVEILKRSIGNIEDVVTIIDGSKTILSHTLSGRRVMNLYKSLIEICDDLDIRCPLLIFTNEMGLPKNRGGHLAQLDESGEIEKEALYVRTQGYYYMLHTLAHELRHMYQQKNDENYFENQITPEESQFFYTYGDDEIDANAYGVLVVEKMTGKDGMKYVLGDITQYNNPSFETLKSMIRMCMNDIRNQEGAFQDKRPAI